MEYRLKTQMQAGLGPMPHYGPRGAIRIDKGGTATFGFYFVNKTYKFEDLKQLTFLFKYSDSKLDYFELFDEETQKIIDSYIKYGKETNQKIEIIPFPSLVPITGFLVSVNGEVVKQVITGKSKFGSTPDIEEMEKMTKNKAIKFSEKGNYVFRKIETFPIPVIFIAYSSCKGTGFQLALSCDIRISSNGSIFGFPEVSYGIMPGFGGTQRLARIIGSGMAKQLIYTGEYLEAKEALKYGLINAIYPTDKLLNEAKKIAENIGKNSLNAIKNSKKAINDGLQENIEKAIIIEEKLFGDCFETQDQKDSMKNFINKNKSKK